MQLLTMVERDEMEEVLFELEKERDRLSFRKGFGQLTAKERVRLVQVADEVERLASILNDDLDQKMRIVRQEMAVELEVERRVEKEVMGW